MDCFNTPKQIVTLLTLALLAGMSGCTTNSTLEQAIAAANNEIAAPDSNAEHVNSQILALIADNKGANSMSENKHQNRTLILKNTDTGISKEHEFILNSFIQLNPVPTDHLAALHVPTGKGDFILMGTRLRHARQLTELLAKQEIWAEIKLDPELPENQFQLVVKSIFEKSVSLHWNSQHDQ